MIIIAISGLLDSYVDPFAEKEASFKAFWLFGLIR